MDTFVDMVMRWPGKGPSDQTVHDIIANHEVNTLGVHLLLWTAQSMGIKSGVYISTRTVHNLPTTAEGRPTYFQAEETMAARQPERLRPDEGPRRTDLRVLRAALRHADHRAADHGAADA